MPETTTTLVCAACGRERREVPWGGFEIPVVTDDHRRILRWARDARIEMAADSDALHASCAKLAKRRAMMRHRGGR